MAQSESRASHHSIDALVPSEIARGAELVGAQKVRLDFWSLIVLAILAGAFIALGAMFATTVLAGANGILPFGVSKLLAGAVFCLGLILVVLGGGELFTGNTLMVMTLASGKVRLGEMLRAWAIVYLGNLLGAIGMAGLVFLAGQYRFGNGDVARVALGIAVEKINLPFDQALFPGILCNVLVCLAVWLSLGARTTTDKVLAMLFPVSAFRRRRLRALRRKHVSHSAGASDQGGGAVNSLGATRHCSCGPPSANLDLVLGQPRAGDHRQHRRWGAAGWRCLLVCAPCAP